MSYELQKASAECILKISRVHAYNSCMSLPMGNPQDIKTSLVQAVDYACSLINGLHKEVNFIEDAEAKYRVSS